MDFPTGLPLPVALAVIAVLGYLVGRRSRAQAVSEADKARRELRRAKLVAKELEQVAESVRKNLANHQLSVARFKDRIGELSGREKEAAWQELCGESEQILKPTLRLAEQGEPLLAIAALVMAYGLVQVAHGYGFIGVFACGLTLRAAERGHEYHRSMHDVVQRLERLLTLIILLLLGMGLTNGLLGSLDWRGVLVALALVFLIRPVAGVVSLRLRPRSPDLPGGLARKEALAAAFFGVRGVGSLYYLAYATGHEYFPEERWLWSTVAFAIVVSVVVHGVLATPVMNYLEGRRERAGAARAR